MRIFQSSFIRFEIYQTYIKSPFNNENVDVHKRTLIERYGIYLRDILLVWVEITVKHQTQLQPK